MSVFLFFIMLGMLVGWGSSFMCVLVSSLVILVILLGLVDV